ncbi:hypothetical protein LB518_10080 [Mesorhizobium sp. BR1-1-16]|uniref:hypothetical protein n=1 Tax=Mesorhizobium sp. BR1-1-16 TaxID=2876653 RepID=UPI001CC9AD34|nr:hypothetical protein [Mesorhizobium sp. BR1-1-16]MBZ9936643.1 hypothetical protein [Mesorhizobium sp. BR1-1-16]
MSPEPRGALAATRVQFADAALEEFRQVMDADEPLRSMANAFYALVSCVNMPGPELAGDTVDAVVTALGATIPVVIDGVADDLPHDQIVDAIGAASHLFRLYSGPRTSIDIVSEQCIIGLGHQMLWLRGALEELHHRREMKKRGGGVFGLPGASAVNVGRLH